MSRIRIPALAAALLLIGGCASSVAGSAETWTVMVFANADNDLEQYIVSDIKELERGAADNSPVKFIALLDRNNGYSTAYGDRRGAHVYDIEHSDSADLIDSPELVCEPLGITPSADASVNMGDPAVLSTFVSWVSANYPADHYALIIEGHGNGWFEKTKTDKSISPDFSSGQDSFSPAELQRALTGKNIDILIFDACLMGTIETLYQIKDCVRYCVASPFPVPNSGFDYTSLAMHVCSTAGTPDDFSRAVLSSFAQSNPFDAQIMMRYDTSAIESFVDGGSIDALAAAIDSLSSIQRSSLYSSLYKYHVDGVSAYVDLNILSASVSNGSIPALLGDAIVSASGPAAISIYWPESAATYDADYDTTLAFTASTIWEARLRQWLGL